MLNKIRFDIIALILSILSNLFFGTIGFIISVVLLVLYYICAKKYYFTQKLFLIFCIIGAFLYFIGLNQLNGMTNTGIDGIGEAIVYGSIVNIGRIIMLICPLIILILDNKEKIFVKKNIIAMLIIIIGSISFVPIKYLLTTKKVSNDIPTLNDFRRELSERGFSTDNSSIVYGISGKDKKAVRIYFDSNNDKYPMYIYTMKDYNWLIYYCDGEIYAVKGIYYYSDSPKEEKIIWKDKEVLSEKEEITIYDVKHNRYKKGNNITYGSLDYHSNNKEIENSKYIDIPEIQSWGTKVKVVDRVDYNSLLNY